MEFHVSKSERTKIVIIGKSMKIHPSIACLPDCQLVCQSQSQLKQKAQAEE